MDVLGTAAQAETLGIIGILVAVIIAGAILTTVVVRALWGQLHRRDVIYEAHQAEFMRVMTLSTERLETVAAAQVQSRNAMQVWAETVREQQDGLHKDHHQVLVALTGIATKLNGGPH